MTDPEAVARCDRLEALLWEARGMVSLLGRRTDPMIDGLLDRIDAEIGGHIEENTDG